MEHQADRLFGGSARRAGDAGDTDSQGRAAALADSFRQGGRNFLADGAVFFDQRAGTSARAVFSSFEYTTAPPTK